jgi:hypothetical protein
MPQACHQIKNDVAGHSDDRVARSAGQYGLDGERSSFARPSRGRHAAGSIRDLDSGKPGLRPKRRQSERFVLVLVVWSAMTTISCNMTINIIPRHRDPGGKLAEAELHFVDGPLVGMKLIGFTVWQHRDSGKRYVTFPARHLALDGHRTTSDLFLPITDAKARDAVRDLILGEYQRVATTVV